MEIEARVRWILVIVQRSVKPGARPARVEVVGHHADPVERRRHIGVLERIDCAGTGTRSDREELVGSDRPAQRGQEQDVVVRIARLARVDASGDGMLPVDVDAVELRIGAEERRARRRKGLTAGVGARHLVERTGIRPAADRHQEPKTGVLLLEQRDLIEEAVRTARFLAVAVISLLSGSRSIPRQPVVRGDLAERVVHVRQPVRGYIGQWITRRRPVGVVADDPGRVRRLRDTRGGGCPKYADDEEAAEESGNRRAHAETGLGVIGWRSVAGTSHAFLPDRGRMILPRRPQPPGSADQSRLPVAFVEFPPEALPGTPDVVRDVVPVFVRAPPGLRMRVVGVPRSCGRPFEVGKCTVMAARAPDPCGLDDRGQQREQP